MNKRQYRDLMKDIIKLQIQYATEDLRYLRATNQNEAYKQGVIAGLQIAIQKLDESDFLLDDDYNEEVK